MVKSAVMSKHAALNKLAAMRRHQSSRARIVRVIYSPVDFDPDNPDLETKWYVSERIYGGWFDVGPGWRQPTDQELRARGIHPSGGGD